MKAFLGVVFMAGLGLSMLGSCSEADELVDCQKICSRYEECVDDEFDVSECRSKCETNADKDEAFAKKADECESCVDDKSCTGAVFNCGVQCVGIVP